MPSLREGREEGGDLPVENFHVIVHVKPECCETAGITGGEVPGHYKAVGEQHYYSNNGIGCMVSVVNRSA